MLVNHEVQSWLDKALGHWCCPGLSGLEKEQALTSPHPKMRRVLSEDGGLSQAFLLVSKQDNDTLFNCHHKQCPISLIFFSSYYQDGTFNK